MEEAKRKGHWAELREIAVLPLVKGHREHPKWDSRVSQSVWLAELDRGLNSVQYYKMSLGGLPESIRSSN